jgi:hypothetical protein
MSGGVWTLIALLFEPGRPGAALRKVSRVAAAPFPRAAARRRVPPAARPWLPCWPHSSWPNPAAAAQAGTRPARSRPPRCRCRRAARSTRPSPRRRSPRAWLPPLAPVAKARQACVRPALSKTMREPPAGCVAAAPSRRLRGRMLYAAMLSLSRGPPAAHGVAPLWGTPGGSGDANPPYRDPTPNLCVQARQSCARFWSAARWPRATWAAGRRRGR